MPDLLPSPCPNVYLDDATHTYWADGAPVATSVTQVLRVGDSPEKIAAIEATRHQWAERGTAVHLALETWIRSGRSWRPDPEDPRFAPFAAWIDPLLSWSGWDALEFIASELLFHSPSRDLAGQCDGIYRADGRTILFDLKTRGRADSGTYSTAAQLGGYASLAAEHNMRFDGMVTIWSRPGKWPAATFATPELCGTAWDAAWRTYIDSLLF